MKVLEQNTGRHSLHNGYVNDTSTSAMLDTFLCFVRGYTPRYVHRSRRTPPFSLA